MVSEETGFPSRKQAGLCTFGLAHQHAFPPQGLLRLELNRTSHFNTFKHAFSRCQQQHAIGKKRDSPWRTATSFRVSATLPLTARPGALVARLVELQASAAPQPQSGKCVARAG